eukprot:TRINITY_DN2856_c0_g1_i1.p1 TRINITY_DN2856_c0_g1~~TRINITY_DN2856_c0_g1_i1.p1  ORF type:complete len:1193 (+),score=218.58 TRINITY_DN2856_c0_g1_i1:345-3581(+)
MAADFEIHKGSDNIFWALDFARLLPPNSPYNPFTSYFRYNFLQNYKEKIPKFNGLSPDAFTGFGEIDRDKHDTEVYNAIKHLETAEINSFVAGIVRGKIQFKGHYDLIETFHRHGINLRYMGLVLHKLRYETYGYHVDISYLQILFEMVLRCIKKITRDLLQQVMKESPILINQPLVEAVHKFFSNHIQLQLGHEHLKISMQFSGGWWKDEQCDIEISGGKVFRIPSLNSQMLVKYGPSVTLQYQDLDRFGIIQPGFFKFQKLYAYHMNYEDNWRIVNDEQCTEYTSFFWEELEKHTNIVIKELSKLSQHISFLPKIKMLGDIERLLNIQSLKNVFTYDFPKPSDFESINKEDAYRVCKEYFCDPQIDILKKFFRLDILFEEKVNEKRNINFFDELLVEDSIWIFTEFLNEEAWFSIRHNHELFQVEKLCNNLFGFIQRVCEIYGITFITMRDGSFQYAYFSMEDSKYSNDVKSIVNEWIRIIKFNFPLCLIPMLTTRDTKLKALNLNLLYNKHTAMQWVVRNINVEELLLDEMVFTSLKLLRERLFGFSQVDGTTAISMKYCEVENEYMNTAFECLTELFPNMMHINLDGTDIGSISTINSNLIKSLSLKECAAVDNNTLLRFYSDKKQVTFPNLESLVLSGTSITGEGLVYLEKLKNLTHLELCGCKPLTDSDLDPIIKIIIKLVVFKIADTNTSGKWMKKVKRRTGPKKRNSCLEILDMSNTEIDDDDIKLITIFTRLVELYLVQCVRIKGYGLKDLAILPDLSYLDISIEILTSRLELIHDQISSLSLKSLQYLTNLKFLSIGYRYIDDDLLVSLNGIENLNTLKIAKGNNLTAYSLKVISQFPRLRTLDLRDYNGNLKSLENHQLLSKLSLRGLGDSNMDYSTVLGSMENLKLLDLRKACINDHDLEQIGNCSQLRYLSLHQASEISNEACQYISQLENLTFLDIGGTSINDDGILNFASLHKLLRCNLFRCDIGDVGVECLSRLPALIHIDLRACERITGAILLEHVPKFLSLLHLELGSINFNSEISMEQIIQLTELISDLEIYLSPNGKKSKLLKQKEKLYAKVESVYRM